MNPGSQIYSYSVVNAKIYRHVRVWMNALSIGSYSICELRSNSGNAHLTLQSDCRTS
jgi:hypothetical protein